MKVFKITYNETLYYAPTIVEAENKEEAKEKFAEMLNEGEVEVNDSEGELCDIQEVHKSEGKIEVKGKF
jgi:hypothetical protein